MAEMRIEIHYQDTKDFVRTHVVREETNDFAGDTRDAAEIICQYGFFLVMEPKEFVFIPASRVLKVCYDHIEEDGS